MVRRLVLGLCLVFCSACSVPAMRVDDALARATPALPVQGRFGWQVNQVIRFGEYQAGPVKRGWTRGYDYPFVIRFSGAKERLEFAVHDGAGNLANALCLGKLSEIDLITFREYFDINLRTRDAFSCTVVVEPFGSFDFFVADLNQNGTSGDVEASVRGPELEAAIRPVWHLQNGQRSWDTRPIGFEMLSGETVLAAVETVNEGRVWLAAELEETQRLVLAGVAAALLLRSDLADHND